ncbi:MAG: translation initiation factor IF-2 [Dehalococcoidia bacterium]
MSPRASNRSTTSKTKTGRKTVKPNTQLVLTRSIVVKDLASLLGISSVELIKRLMRKSVMANINQTVDYDTAASIATELGYKPVAEEEEQTSQTKQEISSEETKAQKPRPPVVTILGHVDHGKTTLLDTIRHSKLTDKEVGEITQHIGAYQVEVNEQKITFIDTPGHEAFTTMRAQGARVTDIAILIISAEDGIMPQTVEAIDHARAAEVPIIAAINKIDKPTADADRAKKQLAEHNVIIEEWGGDVIVVPVSAKTGEGVDNLLEHILIIAEIEELKANPDTEAKGVVLEAKLDNTRGVLATLLVKDGTLNVGDCVVVADTYWGRLRAMFDEWGKSVKSAGPSTPVEVMGLNEVPQAGSLFTVVANEHEARERIEEAEAERQRARKGHAPSLDSVSAQIRNGVAKGLNLIIKTDVQGSIEPVRKSLEQLENEEVKVRIVHAGSGTITESDVMLAIASKSIIIGFNTRPEPRTKRLADSERIEIRSYQTIYRLIEDLQKTVTGMLEPTYVDVTEGHAEIRAIFPARSGKVAGCYITDGKGTRKSLVRVMRNGQVVHESNVESLNHFKDAVSEMAAGNECGVGVEGFSDFAVGDILEFYHKEKQ